MMPGIYPVSVYRGDSLEWRVVIWTDQHRSIPLDLTFTQAKAEIREQHAAVRAYPLTCTVTLPNIIDVYLSAHTSRDLPEEGAWDLELTQIDRVFTILRGPVVVVDDITNSRAGQQTGPLALPSRAALAFPKRGVRIA
jgi:hypothetical protein